jgi:hypothetical protein
MLSHTRDTLREISISRDESGGDAKKPTVRFIDVGLIDTKVSTTPSSNFALPVHFLMLPLVDISHLYLLDHRL